MAEDQHQYSNRVDVAIRRESDKAFSELTGDKAIEDARSMHNQLFDWLLRVNQYYSTPTSLATPDLVEKVELGIRQALHAQGTSAGDALKAWAAMDDTAAHAATRAILAEVLGLATGGLLMSRQSPDLPWEAIGFHADSSTNSVCVKRGTEPYQPIGFDDGKAFIPTSGGRLIWRREWAFALMLPFGPAFDVRDDEVKAQPFSDGVALSDRERERMQDVLTWLTEDSKQLSLVETMTPEAVADLHSKIRDSINLATIQLPRLDAHLLRFEREHPEVGKSMINVKAPDLIRAVREFLQMKLDEDAVRRLIDRTSLDPGTAKDTYLRLLLQAQSCLKLALGPTPETADGEEINAALSEMAMALPNLKEFIKVYEQENPDATAVAGAGVVSDWLTTTIAEAQAL